MRDIQSITARGVSPSNPAYRDLLHTVRNELMLMANLSAWGGHVQVTRDGRRVAFQFTGDTSCEGGGYARRPFSAIIQLSLGWRALRPRGTFILRTPNILKIIQHVVNELRTPIKLEIQEGGRSEMYVIQPQK